MTNFTPLRSVCYPDAYLHRVDSSEAMPAQARKRFQHDQETLEQASQDIWLEQVRACGATAEQIAASLLCQREDRCVTVDDQLQWMRKAGFPNASCAHQQDRFAVLYGHVEA